MGLRAIPGVLGDTGAMSGTQDSTLCPEMCFKGKAGDCHRSGG